MEWPLVASDRMVVVVPEVLCDDGDSPRSNEGRSEVSMSMRWPKSNALPSESMSVKSRDDPMPPRGTP